MKAISEHVKDLTKATAKLMAYSEVLDELPEECDWRRNINRKVLDCTRQAAKWMLMDANLLKNGEEPNADEVKRISAILLPACIELADHENQDFVYLASIILWKQIAQKHAEMIKSDVWQNAKHEIDEMLE